MEEFDALKCLIVRNRSCRRFDQSVEVTVATLKRLVDLTRYTASGRNAQPLKYRLVYNPKECAEVFQTLAWAGYYTDWSGPEEGERPTAYLIQCLDTDISKSLLCDDGIQLETIGLGATALGLGGCIIKAFKTDALVSALHLPHNLVPIYVYAIGKPAEERVIEDMDDKDEFKYYRTSDGVHHVPKRKLSQLIIGEVSQPEESV